DVRDGGLKICVHDQLAATVGHQPDGLQIQLVAVRLPPDSVEQGRSVNRFSALQLGENPVAFGVEADGHNFFSEPKHCAELAKLKAEAFDNLAIAKLEQSGTLVQQGDLHAQRG